MSTSHLLVVGSVALLIAACTSSAEKSSAEGGPSGDGTAERPGSRNNEDGGRSNMNDAAPGQPGSPHTPATGCHDGFVACTDAKPPVCAHVEDDASHCATCGNACPAGSCVSGQCVEGSTCTYGAMCGDACIENRDSNVDHCGSCFNSCADNALCIDGTCTTNGGGNGSSCTSPLLVSNDEESTGFARPSRQRRRTSSRAGRSMRFQPSGSGSR